MRVFLEGIGLRADGLDGWSTSQAVLSGACDFARTPIRLPPSPLLPPAERRRTVSTVKLCLLVASDAFAAAQRDPAATATVFTSSGGDGETIHGILETLAADEIEVSPTRFHNSVHNAPSGYWTIATGTHEPTTCLCVHDASFSAGLLDAAAQVNVDDRAVGLVAYDLPYPEPLNAVRTITSVFAVALILTPAATPATFATLDIELTSEACEPTKASGVALEALRRGNPAARSLPLLQALARRSGTRIMLEHLAGNSLVVSVAPVG
jgi:hypothetical protein